MTFPIHILAYCSERKRIPPPTTLQLRNIKVDGSSLRARSWWEEIERITSVNTTKIRALELYSGGYWSVVKKLPIAASLVGFSAQLWVISAGYGLVSANALLQPYAATFTISHPDSVTTTSSSTLDLTDNLQEWWNALSQYDGPEKGEPRSIKALVNQYPHDPILIIASPSYLRAIAKDVTEAISHHEEPDRFVILSSQCQSWMNKIIQNQLIKVEARLQSQFGGALTEIHARTAEQILRAIPPSDFNLSTVNELMETWLSVAPLRPQLNRSRLSNESVVNFIEEYLKTVPQISCSALLRILRDSGQACEQSRFKNLFESVKK